MQQHVLSRDDWRIQKIKKEKVSPNFPLLETTTVNIIVYLLLVFLFSMH